jgi:hypothetical protein
MATHQLPTPLLARATFKSNIDGVQETVVFDGADGGAVDGPVGQLLQQIEHVRPLINQHLTQVIATCGEKDVPEPGMPLLRCA